MKNLFNEDDKIDIIERLNKLAPESKALWGKMSVAQMMAHCQTPLYVALGEKKLKGGWMAFLFGKIAKKQLVKEEPFKRNLPTSPSFIIKGDKVFNEEKTNLKVLIERFGKADVNELASNPHPFFGKLSASEWNTLQWKHLDHHFRQFGV